VEGVLIGRELAEDELNPALAPDDLRDPLRLRFELADDAVDDFGLDPAELIQIEAGPPSLGLPGDDSFLCPIRKANSGDMALPYLASA
jgi:hypothetical protein